MSHVDAGLEWLLLSDTSEQPARKSVTDLWLALGTQF